MSNSWKFFDKQSDKVERALKTYLQSSHFLGEKQKKSK